MHTQTGRISSPLSTGGGAAFWFWWIAACAAGGILLGSLFIPGDFFVHLIARGFILGAAQWLVLRRYLPGALWWIPATGLGLVCASLLTILPPLSGIITATYTALYHQFGLWEVFWINLVQEAWIWGIVGVAQWLVLRRYAGAALWIPLSVVSGALMGMAGAAVCYVGCDALGAEVGIPAPAMVTNGTAWALYGVATGWFLMRIIPGEAPHTV